MAFDITPGFNMPGLGDIKRGAANLTSGFVYGGQQGSKQSGPVQDYTRKQISNGKVLGVSTDGGSYTARRTGQSGAATTYPGQVTENSFSDPFSKWGGQGAYNALVDRFNSQKSNIFGSARDAAGNAGLNYKNSILDFLDSLRSGQQSIDEQGIQAELAKKQGSDSILDMVNRGVRSGGVMLANKNAGDSSAAGAIARAYGDMGRREMSNVGNQYEQQQRAIDMSQEDLMRQQASGTRKLGDSKTQMVNNIVTDARDKLAQLDAQMMDADLPTRIAIEQERNAIKNEVMGILSKFDSQLTQGVKGVKAKSREQRRAEALNLATKGVAPENAFDFNTEAPAEFQNTGPFAGDLPLFSLPRGRDESLA